MSTVDPAIARRRQRLQAGAPARPGWRAWLLVAACAGLWAMFGYGVGDVATYPIATGYLAPELQPPNEVPGLLWMLFVGVFGAMILGFGVDAVLSAALGGVGGTLATFAVNLAAIALGLWRGAADRWVAPPRPGFFDPAAALPWGAGGWLSWTAQYWAPALLATLAALLAWAALAARRRHLRQQRRMRETLAQGQRTTGLVTETQHTGVEVDNEPRIRFVARFTDHLGAERWVTKTGQFDASRVPRVGDEVQVWFLREAPGDEDRIVVGFGSAEDAQIEERLAAQ
ncbi:DUF3592 domain-containing protein [Lysobacter enzymogenes]|uniref:DUF3592 domain-containing protein n=1 Tax=Lysobacter enzymogenes TaxID=69 RepID=A0AAU9AU27_LYSEN|nr:DUF3592 domain-containing protein [Lysobacter enzymogenes]BAW00121.1 conserved hypothetical protein [Lysobacter enzymogenes]